MLRRVARALFWLWPGFAACVPEHAVLPAPPVVVVSRERTMAGAPDAEMRTGTSLAPDPPPEPAPEPPFDPFPDREDVTVDELAAAIDELGDALAESPEIRRDFEALVAAKGLRDTPELYRDYVRVKLAFEATRDGGWWGLRWAITNEQPNSDRIWSQWRETTAPEDDDATVTATAECDELSALFAFVARKLGVHGIGLFWPTWNHVVAVWTVPGVQTEAGSPVRIIVPTSQIFLTQDDTLGTEGFDPWKQKTIYEYRRRDVKGEHRLDADLARFFVRQIAAHGRASQAELQRARNERVARRSAG